MSSTSKFIQRAEAMGSGQEPLRVNKLLKIATKEEEKLRALFRTSRGRQDPSLADPYAGLVNPFNPDLPPILRTIQSPTVSDSGDTLSNAEYLFPLGEDRKEAGTPCMVKDIPEFLENFSIWSANSFTQIIDWSNTIVAGGAVTACLQYTKPEHRARKHELFQQEKFRSGDTDVFLWGMTPDQALRKVLYIWEAIRCANPMDMACVQTERALTIYSSWPYQPIQIVLRLYSSPAEILTEFDIDCCAFLFNGTQVFGSPRAIISMMTQANTVDMSRCSPSYEYRLCRHALRGYEVHVPTFERSRVNPLIYNNDPSAVDGLPRLLVLEKLLGGTTTAGSSRPPYGPGIQLSDTVRWFQAENEKSPSTVYDGDSEENVSYNNEDTDNESDNYSSISRHAKVADDEEAQRDLLRHLSFWSPAPDNRYRITRFNHGELQKWSAGAYVSDLKSLFYIAIATHDRELVQAFLKRDGHDINEPDKDGKTALHVAILVKAEDIAHDLIDAGVKIGVLLPDSGMNALHLAVRTNTPNTIRKLAERNLANQSRTDDLEMDTLDINLKCRSNGLTPLSLALTLGFFVCVNELIKAGASPDHITCNNLTHLHLVNSFSHHTTGDGPEAATEGVMPSNSAVFVDIRRLHAYIFTQTPDELEPMRTDFE